MAHVRGPLTWLVATVVACGAIGLAYVPPRGVSRDPRSPLSGMMTGAPTIERQRANVLAKEWRRAAMEVRLHEWRRQLAPELERLRAANQPTFVTSIDTAWPRELRERAARATAAAWQALGLGTTKIGVALIIEPERVTASAPSPIPIAYLLPDSADRHTCIAWAAPSSSSRALLERSGEEHAWALVGWMRRVLGPCAFYASFGRPSHTVESWLAARQYRIAQAAAWDSETTRYELPWFARPGTRWARAEWARWAYDQYPPVVLGCMAERSDACRDAVGGGVPAHSAVTRLVTRARDSDADLPGATLLLSEIVREFGPVRFARLWSSDLPPDSAFHIAMDTRLGDWVVSRQRAYGTTLAAGPTASFVASAFGLGIAALGLILAVAAATRRQVG